MKGAFPDKGRFVPGVVQRATISAMRKAKGDRAEAARILGVSRKVLRDRLASIRPRLEAAA